MKEISYRDHLYTFERYDSLLQLSEEYLFSRVYELLKLSDGDKILDVGCGTGAFRRKYPEVKNYVGIDLSTPNLQSIPKNLGCFANMDATKLGIRQETFTRVICCEVLEHVEEDVRRRIIEEIKCVLVPDGIVVFTVPNALYLWSYLPWSLLPIKSRSTVFDLITVLNKGYFDEGHPIYTPHYRFTPKYFSEFIQSCGFEMLNLETTYWYNNRYINHISKNFQYYLWSKLTGWKLGSQIVLQCRPF